MELSYMKENSQKSELFRICEGMGNMTRQRDFVIVISDKSNFSFSYPINIRKFSILGNGLMASDVSESLKEVLSVS